MHVTLKDGKLDKTKLLRRFYEYGGYDSPEYYDFLAGFLGVNRNVVRARFSELRKAEREVGPQVSTSAASEDDLRGLR